MDNDGGTQMKLDSSLTLKILIERNRRIAGYEPDYTIENCEQIEEKHFIRHKLIVAKEINKNKK